MGVTFYKVDKQPFIDSAKPLHDNFKAKNADYARYFERYSKLRKIKSV